MISQIPNVGVGGGTCRNPSWVTGKRAVCKQRQHPQNECMYCDYLQGPSVTKTNLLNFDAELPNEVLFED